MKRMYSLFPCMIALMALIGFSACTMNTNIKQSTMGKPNNFNTVLCKGYINKGGSYEPFEITNKFIKGEDKSVCILTEFFDITPNTKYKPKWEWYGPNLELIASTCIK